MTRRFATAQERTSDRSKALTGIAPVVLPRAERASGQLRLPPPLASVSYSGVTLSGSPARVARAGSIDRAFFAV
jgi:hypothetical protein